MSYTTPATAAPPGRLLSLRRSLPRGAGRVPAGIVDSGLSSLATFVIGLAAVRYLTIQDLGAYALAYTAFLLANAVPAMLVFTPAEVRSIAERRGVQRLTVVRTSLRLGVPTAVAAATVVGGATLLVPSSAPQPTRLAFAVTLVAVCAVSPVQDHLRRVLHQSGRSWTAAGTSGLQLACALLLLGVLIPLGFGSSPWVPFGVLAAVNVVSSGFALNRCLREPGPGVGLTVLGAARQGGGLLVGTMASFATNFAVIAIVTAASGAAAAGQLEATRLLAQPVTVVIIGVLAVLGPDIMTSAVSGDRVAAHRRIRRFLLLISALAVAYATVTVVPWPGDPLRALVPRAFDVPLLLPAMVLSQALGYATHAYRQVPLALRRSDHIVVADLLAAGTALITVILLAETGAWAGVWPQVTSGVVAMSLFGLSTRFLLRRRSASAPDGGGTP